MSPAVADAVRDRCRAVVVSDAYRLAPWADALVSQDSAWWRAHPEALQFAGRRLSGGYPPVPGTERVTFDGGISTASNSGLLACHVAVYTLGARRLLLCGFDMGGSHFFGKHPAPLKNTAPHRFDVFRQQFAQFRPRGVEILNCTPGSALHCYPKKLLTDALISV